MLPVFQLRVLDFDQLRGRLCTVIIGCGDCREEPIRALWDSSVLGVPRIGYAQHALEELHKVLGVGHECGDEQVYMDADQFTEALEFLWKACLVDQNARKK